MTNQFIQSDYSQYPDFKNKQSREIADKKIKIIRERLDKLSSLIAILPDPLSPKRRILREFSVEAVWAIGSYARGAVTYNDIELLVEFKDKKHKKSHGFMSTIYQQLFSAIPGVRIYAGTPSDNFFQRTFNDIHLIWKKGLSWQLQSMALESRPNNPLDTPIADVIPLREEQVPLTSSTLSAMLEARSTGVLKWSFIPLSKIKPVPLSKSEEVKAMWLSEESKAILPFILGLAKFWYPRAKTSEWIHNPLLNNSIIVSRSAFFDNRELKIEYLEDLSIDRLVMVPHLTKRGANGAWVIERGENWNPTTWRKTLIKKEIEDDHWAKLIEKTMKQK